MEIVVVLSLRRVLSETARIFVEREIRHTAASKKWRAFKALRIISGGGSEVYFVRIDVDGDALPIRNSSSGLRRQRIRLSIDQIGSRKVARIAGR